MSGIADYGFVGQVGTGPRAEVFLAARPPRLPVEVDQVAVKVLSAHSTADTFRRATVQLRACASLRSPYLLTLYDVGQHDGVFYLTMEHMAQGSLTGSVNAGRALRAVADGARGAADLHAAGLVHQGIHPGNILVASYGAKLAEPDLSQVFTPGLLAAGPRSAVECLDPARLRGEPARPYHDVWSLGVLLHRVAAGSSVYGDLPADPVAALRRVLAGPPAVSGVLPASLAELIRDCLAEPERRPSAATVAERLDQL